MCGSGRRGSGLRKGLAPLPVSAGVSGCPGWSPAPDGRPPALCSCLEPDASSAPPPLTAARSPASATTRRSPAGTGRDGVEALQTFEDMDDDAFKGAIKQDVFIKRRRASIKK